MTGWRIFWGIVLGPIVYAFIAATGKLVAFALVFPALFSGGSSLNAYMAFGAVVMALRTGYLATIALGVPAFFVLRWRGWNGRWPYLITGAVLGCVSGLAEHWSDIGSRIPNLGAMATGLMMGAFVPLSVPAAVAGAFEAAVFWLIAKPETPIAPARAWVWWSTRTVMIGAALVVGAGFLIPIGERLYDAIRYARPINELASVPYAVWDSGIYPGSVDEHNNYYWLDDDTVLIHGGAGAKPGPRDDASKRTFALYAWRLGEAPRALVTDVDSVQGCGANGFVTYSFVERIKRSDPRISRAGPLGQETEVPPRPAAAPTPLPSPQRGNASNERRLIDIRACEPIADPAMAGRSWVTDTSRRYRLEFGAFRISPDRSEPVVLLRADGSDRVVLPITRGDAEPRCTHFHQFDGRFLVWDCAHFLSTDALARWKANGNCWPFWRIEPESASIEKSCLPFGDWVGSTIDLIPSKAGLFFTSHKAPAYTPHDVGATGLYALRDGNAKRVLKGFINAPVISPSGCKVVFYFVRDNDAHAYGRPGSPTVAVIDLCAPKT